MVVARTLDCVLVFYWSRDSLEREIQTGMILDHECPLILSAAADSELDACQYFFAILVSMVKCDGKYSARGKFALTVSLTKGKARRHISCVAFFFTFIGNVIRRARAE